MQTLSLSLSDQLIQAIVSGELAAGSKISEPTLAKRFGVGRGSLRESLLRLEGLGLVERSPRIGARVVTLSPKQLMELFTVREALEGMAARLAAKHITAEEIDALGQLLETHADYLEQVDGQAYSEQEGDLDFHYRVIKASRNPKLISMLCDELYHLVRMYRRQSVHVAARPQRALREHLQILDALVRRDGELAELLMRRHISRAASEISARLNHSTDRDIA